MTDILRATILALFLSSLGCATTAVKTPTRADMVSRLEPWRELWDRDQKFKKVFGWLADAEVAINPANMAELRDSDDLLYSYQAALGPALLVGDFEAYDRYIKEANSELDRIMAVLRKTVEGQTKESSF